MNIRSALTDLKGQLIDGKPMTETSIQVVMVLTVLAFLAIPLFALGTSRFPAVSSLVLPFQSKVARAPLEIRPVLVASAEQAGAFIAPLAAESALAPKEPEEIVHPVQARETLIGILKVYCRDDYEVVARENGIADPDKIYAGRTVLKFTNGCLGNAPSVLVKQSVSPRELVSNGGASSGKHISRTEATRAPIAAPAVALAAAAPTPTASQSSRRAKVASLPVPTVECDSEEIAPKDLLFNERARRMQVCFMKHHRLGQGTALKKAKNLLVAAMPKPETVSCEAESKQGLDVWAACMRTHHGEALRAAAAKHRHDENLLLAVAFTESSGNPFAVSPSWCLSLMQILPSTAEKFGVDLRSIFDPHVNLDTGAKVLRAYLDIARGNLDRALASYNLGPGEVQDRMNSPEGFDPAVFTYTQKVQRVYRYLRAKDRPLRAKSLDMGNTKVVANRAEHIAR